MLLQDLWLRLGCIGGIALGCYPLVWLCVIGGQGPRWTTLVLAMGLLLGAWIGAMVRLLLFWTQRRHRRLVDALLALLTGLGLALGYVLAPFSQTLPAAIYGLLLGGCLFAGTRLVLLPLERLSHGYVLLGICLVGLGGGLLCQIWDQTSPMLPLVAVLVLNTLLHIVAQNTRSLRRQVSGGSRQEQKVPWEVRQGNRRVLLLFCLLGGAILLFYRPLTALLRWIGGWIRTGLWYLLRWLLQAGETTPESAPPASVSQRVEQLEQNTTADWIWLVVWLVLLAGLVALVVWQRRSIWNQIQQAWRSICQWVSRLWHKKPLPEPEESGYTEYVEALLTQEKRQDPPSFRSRRHWRRAYRRYRQMPKSASRYRLGYGLMLDRLPQDLVRPADSTGELQQKLENRYPGQLPFSGVTAAYDRIRYGLCQPDADAFVSMDAVLRWLDRGGAAEK